MRRLELDFRHARPASPWRWPLLCCGLAALAAVVWQHTRVTAQIRIDQATVRAIEARLPNAAGRGAAANPALASARQVVAKRRQPWGELFATLEKADNKDVALLAFTPDPARGQIKIYAEARNLGAMLAYHRRLEGGALSQVALVEHDLNQDSGNAPVRFHIAADWGAHHERP
jgi:hypothetical protein